MKKFTSKDLSKIKRNTNINNHTENYIFIAHKIKSKTESQFKEILKKADKQGYLDGDASENQYKLYKELMNELKKKAPQDYEDVHSRL